MKKKRKKIVQFQDSALTLLGTVFIVVCFLLCCLMYTLINPNAEDAVIGQIWCSLMFFGIALCPVLCAKQWYTTIVLSKTDIRINIPFQKPQINGYKSYPFIYIGQYHHGSILNLGFDRKFIVLSNIRIDQDVLQRVNLMPSSNKQIKIPLSRRNVSYLESVLPKKQKLLLERLVAEHNLVH